MRIKERVSAVAIFALFAFAFIYSRSFPVIPKMIPTGVSMAGMILCAFLFARTFSSKYAIEEEPKEIEETLSKENNCEDKKTEKKTFLAIIMLIIYVLLINVLGFYVISFIFINAFSYMIDGKNQKWWSYPAVSVGILILIYVIFGLFINVSFPKGFLF